MILRLRARLALLRALVEQAEQQMNSDLNRLGAAAIRALYWLWNAIKTAPGAHQVGHGLATVLGLYHLDRWLVERGIKADLKLADDLAAAGLGKQADMLRTAAAERRLANG